MTKTLVAALLAGAAFVTLPAAAQAATAYALTGNNQLVTFDTDTRKAGKPVAIKGTDGTLLGIDVRPNDGNTASPRTAPSTIDP